MKGPRELCGTADLISRFKLQPYHEFYCKKPIPSSIADTSYLKNVVGGKEIIKGEGMQLDQLCLTTSYVKERGASTPVHPFDLRVLWEAFEMREAAHFDLLSAVDGAETAVANLKCRYKDQMRHKGHKITKKDSVRRKQCHPNRKKRNNETKK